MINQLLHQLAARSEDNPRTARRQPTEPAGLFATELKKQLIGSEHRPTRDAEAESIDEALKREVQSGARTSSTQGRESTLTDLLLAPRSADEEAAAFEDERTAPEVPHLRSSAEQSFSMPPRGQRETHPESMFEERLREQALARFSGEASSTSRQAMVRAGGLEAEHRVPVSARGAAQSLAAAVDQAAREHHPTKPIRQGLLNPPPPGSHARGGEGAERGRPVAMRGHDAERWAAPQVVSTVDKSWKQAPSDDGDAEAANATTAPAAEHAPVETVTADAVIEAQEAHATRGFDDTLRHVVEGDRALAAQTGASATTSAMRAVVDQVRSLLDGLGLAGQLRLRTDGAEVQVQSDTLGTLAARIGVTNGVVDLTLSGQAAASLTAELDALKQMLLEAGLSVGDVKTSTLPGGGEQAQGQGGHERDHDDAQPRSGSGIATDEGQAREASRARRRSHHGQVNVSA